MLTADQVRARRFRDELRLSKIDGAVRARAETIADVYVAVAREHVGATRGEFENALAAVPVAARDRKLANGLRKLVEDRCSLLGAESVSPAQIRSRVFELAATARREATEDQPFDRRAVLERVATESEVPCEQLEGAMYADLREAHVVREFRGTTGPKLVDEYELAQEQAVLLRARRVTARVRCASPDAYRYLFRQLKFRRLMPVVRPAESGGYLLEIDGPMSLFSSVTKYGLSLALVLPAIRACDDWEVSADLLWGRERRPLRFRSSGRGASVDLSVPSASTDTVAFIERFRAQNTTWEVELAEAVLDLPGAGVCVPDLRFTHRTTGEVIWFEILGFWSREAVWRRIDLVRAGLPDRVLFAVSSRLRVGETNLGDDLPSALYVYKGALAPKAVAGRLEQLHNRPAPIPS